MPRHFEKKTLNYTQKQMYDLVSDVESYPEFLPWCRDVRVSEKSGTSMNADMVVGNSRFQESFTSLVTLTEPVSISVRYGGGALKHLVNEWTFKPVNDGTSCEVHFMLDFKLKSFVLGAMMEFFFNQAFQKMVEAFEDRAKQLYGDKKL